MMLVAIPVPIFIQGEKNRLARSNSVKISWQSVRPITASHKAALKRSKVLLRLYPTNEVLTYLFKVSDSTVSRVVNRVTPLLAASGKDTFKMPDPLARNHRPHLAELVNQIPDLDVIIDSCEQRIQRHSDRTEADLYFSGKKKQNTLKSQLSVDARTGLIVHVSESLAGPTSAIKLLEQSGLVKALPEGCNAGGDLGYPGIDKLLPGRALSLEKSLVKSPVRSKMWPTTRPSHG